MISNGIGNIIEMRQFVDESAASLGKKINKLEALNLVTRTVNKVDKRKWDFTLTKKGHREIKLIEQKFATFCNSTLSPLSKKDTADVHRSITTLENIIKK